MMNFESNYLQTQVIDEGLGISEEEMNKLFKFFGKLEKTKSINKAGMGFGLTICKMLVE